MPTKLKRKIETKRKLTIASNSTAGAAAPSTAPWRLLHGAGSDRVPLRPVRPLRLDARKNNDIELEGLGSAGAANE